MFENEFTVLKSEIVSLAHLAVSMIDKSVTGVLDKDQSLFDEVINESEPKANKLELELDEASTSLIARYQPIAKTLRTILMILKMNNDLERLGDTAVNICESGMELMTFTMPFQLQNMVKTMKHEAIEMMNNSISAFTKENPKKAKEVCRRDSVVDTYRDKIIDAAIHNMESDVSHIKHYTHLIRVTRNLERVADLSTNIAEDVLYIVEGEVIKHKYHG